MTKKKTPASKPLDKDSRQRPAKELPGNKPRYDDRPQPRPDDPAQRKDLPARQRSPQFGDNEPGDPRALDLEARARTTARTKPGSPAVTDELDVPREDDEESNSALRP